MQRQLGSDRLDNRCQGPIIGRDLCGEVRGSEGGGTALQMVQPPLDRLAAPSDARFERFGAGGQREMVQFRLDRA